jgi:hypothetical protein
MKNKKYTIVFVVFITILINGLITSTKAQPYYDAYFTSIMVTNGNGTSELLNGGMVKVYDGQPISINTTAYNKQCGILGGNLYIKLYIDNSLFTTSSEAYIFRTTYMGNQFYDYEYGAKIVSYKVELWWGQYLEDERTFSIQVVKLSVTDWSPSFLR